MTYLFFDIECCDGVHICEFGYVLTDEKFNVTERGCITMNPEASFNLNGRPGRRDLILAFTEDQYFQSPTFPTYYEKIKNLLTAEDRLVVGYAPLNDVFFLNNACSRYKLDIIDYPFFDCQRLYEEYRNIRRSVSLDSAQEDLNAEERSDGVHRSDQDSQQTLNLFVTMLKNLEMTTEDVIKLCPRCLCESSAAASEKPQNPTYRTFDAFLKALDEGEEDLSYDIPQFFSAFQNVVKPAGDGTDTKFKGKLFCLSEDFGRERAKEAFLIVQLIANGGGKFSHKAFDCDMFIASDADIKKPRYRRYEQIFVAKTYAVPIYSLDEFYPISGVTREEIANRECCGFCRYSKNKLKRAKRYSPGENEYFHEFFRRLDDGDATFASERRQFFSEYVKCCIPSDEEQDKVLKDKKFTISKDMEREAPRELFVINQIIVNGGGWICNKASESDYYIATDDEYGDPDPGEKTRMFSAIINDVPVISIKELCDMAGYAEDEFSSLRCSDFCKTGKAVLGSEPSKISPPDSIEPTIFELTRNQKYAR